MWTDSVLFSYDKWFNEGELVLNQPIDEPCEAIYRGWMMKPEIYKDYLIIRITIHISERYIIALTKYAFKKTADSSVVLILLM